MILKSLAVLFNTLLLATMAYLLWDHGMPDRAEDIWLATLMILGPAISLVTVLRLPGQDSLIALYFKRLTLEQRAKVQELERQSARGTKP